MSYPILQCWIMYSKRHSMSDNDKIKLTISYAFFKHERCVQRLQYTLSTQSNRGTNIKCLKHFKHWLCLRKKCTLLMKTDNMNDWMNTIQKYVKNIKSYITPNNLISNITYDRYKHQLCILDHTHLNRFRSRGGIVLVLSTVRILVNNPVRIFDCHMLEVNKSIQA